MIYLVNCVNLDSFDLPTPSLASLKTLELSTFVIDLAKDEMVTSMLKNLMELTAPETKKTRRKSSEVIIDDEAIDKINKLFQSGKSTSVPLLPN